MERPQALIGEEWCSAEPDELAVCGNQGFAESTRELDCRLLPSESLNPTPGSFGGVARIRQN